jgi:hypothetical protein
MFCFSSSSERGLFYTHFLLNNPIKVWRWDIRHFYLHHFICPAALTDSWDSFFSIICVIMPLIRHFLRLLDEGSACLQESTYIGQKTHGNADIHPFHKRISNPEFQCSRDKRQCTLHTAWPQWSAVFLSHSMWSPWCRIVLKQLVLFIVQDTGMTTVRSSPVLTGPAAWLCPEPVKSNVCLYI